MLPEAGGWLKCSPAVRHAASRSCDRGPAPGFCLRHLPGPPAAGPAGRTGCLLIDSPFRKARGYIACQVRFAVMHFDTRRSIPEWRKAAPYTGPSKISGMYLATSHGTSGTKCYLRGRRPEN